MLHRDGKDVLYFAPSWSLALGFRLPRDILAFSYTCISQSILRSRATYSYKIVGGNLISNWLRWNKGSMKSFCASLERVDNNLQFVGRISTQQVKEIGIRILKT
jgi:hypothetical protein